MNKYQKKLKRRLNILGSISFGISLIILLIIQMMSKFRILDELGYTALILGGLFLVVYGIIYSVSRKKKYI